MAKRKKKEAPVHEVQLKELEIKKASLRDGFCDYQYKINIGTGAGDTHAVKGSGIIDDDLRNAFRKLHAHLAFIDGGFDNYQLESINDAEDHEVTERYRVTTFDVKGSNEDESIILIGTKYSPHIGENLEIKTDKIRISVDSNSRYKWYNELREVSVLVRDEVEQYKNGKCTPPEVHDSAPDYDPNQVSLLDQDGVNEDEFEASKVD
jgi:hypothetical protein